MSARSTTGQWVVISGPTVVGPFDGKSPAIEFARKMRREGAVAEPRRLWSAAEVLTTSSK